MPELPEVETTRRGIRPALVGARVEAFVVREPRLRWRIDRGLVRELAGRSVHDVRRRAKYLLVDLDGGSLILHLGMSGSLRVLDRATALLPHDHYDLVMDSGRCLRFNDPRRFGSLHWVAGDALSHPLLATLGPEPLAADFDADYLVAKARRRKVAVKQFLMDQKIVVGVGNIYASEALFRAGVSPRRAAGRVERRPVRRDRQGDPRRAQGGHPPGRHDAARLRQRRRHPGLLPPAALRLRADRRALPPLRPPDPAVRAGPAVDLLLPRLPDLTGPQIGWLLHQTNHAKL